MLQIGNISLSSNLLLAPIAGHCDLPFRLVARACARENGGLGIAYTDLLCPHGILKQNEQTQWLMATHEDDAPLGMQLYGQDIELMTEAAKWAVDHGADLIDINMGCPVDKVTKTFAGSMMLCTPDHTVELTRKLVETVDVPVTAKTRLGWAEGELSAPTLARRLVEVGAKAITIHGRTAAKRFMGTVDLEGIASVVDAVHEAGGGEVPCIGNGDVKTPFDARAMIEATGCDGVMIARAALGAPWIFRDTHALLSTGAISEELTLRQRLCTTGCCWKCASLAGRSTA
ncbi:MAG: tRNA dihydrouridine synthase [Planctomycetota bacterium]|jgi:nifR3 family TIM-barrel protein